MHLRLSWILCLLLAACTVAASNWGKDDYEIFELQAALRASEGQNATFYSLLGLERKASAAEIKKAYRKKSMELHPDRNPGRPDAQKRFERLGVINKILRDERRDRYDHFLTNGFPRWRSTGYYYERFRPGLGSVIAFVLILSALIQRLVQGLNYSRDSARLENLRRSAQLLAWGPTFEVPGSASTQQDRKIRVPLQGLEGLPSKPDAKAAESIWTEHEKTLRKIVSTQASAGWAGSRLVDVFVSNSSTYVLDPSSGDRLDLDAESVPRPSILKTWPFALVKKAVGSGKAALPANAGEDAAEGESEVESAASASAKSTAVAGNGSAKKNKKKRK